MLSLAVKIQVLAGWRRFLVALLSGGCAAMALPPLGIWPILFLAVPVVVLLLDGIFDQIHSPLARAKPAFVTGWAFGFGYFGVSLYWVGEAFLVDAEVFAWLMPFAITAMPAGLALFWGLAIAVAAVLWTVRSSRVMILAACWASAEWMRGHVLTGFPWNAPGYAADTVLPIAQSASLIGLYGLCFAVLLWATAPVLLMANNGRYRGLFCILASAVLAFGYGTLRLNQTETIYQSGIDLRIVQPNIAQKDKWQPENRRWIYERYLEMTRTDSSSRSLRIVIWPESALPALLDEQDGTRRQIAEAAGGQAFTILGSLRRNPQDTDSSLFNSVLVIDASGNVAARYDKQKLVPFGEYLPFASVLEPLGLRKMVALPGGFAGGPGPRTIDIKSIPRFAPLICYEAIFPRTLLDRTNRPEWLVNVTNDAWFGRSSGPHQHLTQARMRAIEEGLPLVRAANTGISVVVDPLGRVLHRIELGRRGSIDARLPAPVAATPYSNYGDWPFFALIGLLTFCRVRTFFWKTD